MKQSKFYVVALLLIATAILAACQPAPSSNTNTNTNENTSANENTAATEAATTAATEAATTAATTEATTAATTEATSAPTQEPVVSSGNGGVPVRWYVGLGAGSDAGTIQPQKDFVKAFNASQNKIDLQLEIVANAQAYDTLSTEIAAGNAPDIVGPTGIKGRDSFKGAWLDLQPMIDANKYDLSDFDPATVKFLEVKEEGQLGIPFAIYPSFIFVNKDLFDEAQLPYPPQKFGEPYVDKDGKSQEWNMDTLRDLAMQLTVDKNGADATSADFYPDNIVQYGYMSGLTDMRGALTEFGAGNVVADDGKTAQFPDQWRDGAHWIYDAMWKDHFWPTDAAVNSDVLANGNPFQSGHLAMMQCHMWFAASWALGNITFKWDTAVMPSYKGTTTAKMHADTFGILKASKHPQEAFEVLTYMLSKEHAPDLLKIYGAMPARLSLQGDFFTNYGASVFPGQDINWQVVVDSAAYADHPNHEAWVPSYQESTSKYGEYWTKWAQNPDLDLDQEIDSLVKDLQKIYDASGGK